MEVSAEILGLGFSILTAVIFGAMKFATVQRDLASLQTEVAEYRKHLTPVRVEERAKERTERHMMLKGLIVDHGKLADASSRQWKKYDDLKTRVEGLERTVQKTE